MSFSKQLFLFPLSLLKLDLFLGLDFHSLLLALIFLTVLTRQMECLLFRAGQCMYVFILFAAKGEHRLVEASNDVVLAILAGLDRLVVELATLLAPPLFHIAHAFLR